MSDTRFSYTLDDLRQKSADVLRMAKAAGASSAEAEVSLGVGQNVSVRLDEVETIEYNRDKGMSVTVYLASVIGHASIGCLAALGIRRSGVSIARYTAHDDSAGGGSACWRRFSRSDLYHRWDISVEQAIELARSCGGCKA